MHRFVWSLRYPAPAPLADGDPYADGVWAPPGRYTVELSAGGQRRTQPLTIGPDPRVRASASDYSREFALARRVEGLLSPAADATLAAWRLLQARVPTATN